MKRTLCALLILALCLASVAMAQAPAAGSLRAEKQTIDGNSSWTPESYPEIWLTPFSAQYIIEGRDSERYPANFVCFAPPEGTAPRHIAHDIVSVLDFDTLFAYTYAAYDRHSYELFLEKAEEEEYILADGSDGVAIYVMPSRWGRGRAMIDLKPYFGGTAKLTIEIYDNAGDDLSVEELGKLIQDEASRVLGAMELVELDRFWSQGVFSSVDLFNRSGVSITVDTADMTITRLEDNKLKNQVLVDGAVRETEIGLSSPFGEEVEEHTLADGTPYIRDTWDYWSYAYFFIQEGRSGGEVYLQIKIGVPPEAFAAELEKVYPLIALPGAEQ